VGPLTGPTRDDLWVVGDIQGFLAPFQRVLRDNRLIDPDGGWIAGGSTLVVLGDLVDRGPDGLGAIDFLMRLQKDAARQGGRVLAVIGNHDVQLLAARQFGGSFTTSWLEAGGVQADLDGLDEAHAAWLRELPAVVMERDSVLLHADATFYLEYGSSLVEINAGFRQVLEGEDAAAWQRMLDQFGEHRAFSGPDGEANLGAYLGAFGARQLIHGHTPVPRMLQVPAESVTTAYVYRDGRCVNVDPGIYLGGPGFAYRVTPPTIDQMSDESSESSADEPRGEILPASSPGPAQVEPGMQVMSLDGERVGKVKEVRPDEFLVDRAMARDLWVPFSAMLAAEDYSSNFRRGPAGEAAVVLMVNHAHIESQGWRHG
jgi:hypothetical protein